MSNVCFISGFDGHNHAYKETLSGDSNRHRFGIMSVCEEKDLMVCIIPERE